MRFESRRSLVLYGYENHFTCIINRGVNYADCASAHAALHLSGPTYQAENLNFNIFTSNVKSKFYYTTQIAMFLYYTSEQFMLDILTSDLIHFLPIFFLLLCYLQL